MNSTFNSVTNEGEPVNQASETEVEGDALLIERCKKGTEEAWAALIDKYRNLIFSVPIKYGLSQEDASDVFQQVCLTLLSQLSSIREPRTLPAWVIKVTANQCLQWRARHSRRSKAESINHDVTVGLSPDVPSALLLELEREQKLREAIADMPERCRELLVMLFFTIPAVPYEEVARSLGVALGSVACLRMRCLERLRLRLEEKGFS
jgi:RNA polymerase sigma factor (sigma-70 family)